MIAAVSEDFPALQVVLGEEKFDSLVLAYLRENPSTSFSLRNLGPSCRHGWRRTLNFRGSTCAGSRRCATGVGVYRSVRRSQSRALGCGGFCGPGSGSTLRLQPHLQLLDLQYPVDEVVLAVRKLTPEIDIVSNAVSGRRQASDIALPEVTRSGIYLAVHRFEDWVYYRRIDREEFLLLADLRDGDSIATAIERAFEGSKLDLEVQAAKIQEYFAHAAELGWFCSKRAKEGRP